MPQLAQDARLACTGIRLQSTARFAKLTTLNRCRQCPARWAQGPTMSTGTPITDREGGAKALIERLIKFIRELARRRVMRAAAGYVFVLWVLSLGAADLFPAFGLDDWAVRAFVYAGLLGLPVAIFVSWRYNLTMSGFVRDPGDLRQVDGSDNVPDVPSAAESIREWCTRRQPKRAPSTIITYWADEQRLPRNRRFITPFLMGRDDDNDICVADPRVSRAHAVIWYEAKKGKWMIRDLDSSNGTYLAGQRVDGDVALPSHGEMRMHGEGPAIRFEIIRADETMLTLATPPMRDD